MGEAPLLSKGFWTTPLHTNLCIGISWYLKSGLFSWIVIVKIEKDIWFYRQCFCTVYIRVSLIRIRPKHFLVSLCALSWYCCRQWCNNKFTWLCTTRGMHSYIKDSPLPVLQCTTFEGIRSKCNNSHTYFLIIEYTWY